MILIHRSYADIDWSGILEHLIDGEAIKIYCHNSPETLTIWGINNLLFVQNNTERASSIHNLQGVNFDGWLLQVLVETSLVENNVVDIALIETTDFEITLTDLG